MAFTRITSHELASATKGASQFEAQLPGALAGRCLVDGFEFLTLDDSERDDFEYGVVVNAHAIRLCWSYARELKNQAAVDFLQKYIGDAFSRINKQRNKAAPFFGEDFWDWAYVLDAQVTARIEGQETMTGVNVEDEINLLYEEVARRLGVGRGPFVHDEKEWYGPAIPTAVYRVLNRAKQLSGFTFDKNVSIAISVCLQQLEAMAREPIQGGKYRNRDFKAAYFHWHIGQVAEAFPDAVLSDPTAMKALFDLGSMKMLPEPARSYALARALQGATALGKKDDSSAIIETLCRDSENQKRRFGKGLIGENVKASLNVLEGLWPSLGERDLKIAAKMLDAIVEVRISAAVTATGAASTPKAPKARAKVATFVVSMVPVLGAGLYMLFHDGCDRPPHCEGDRQAIKYEGHWRCLSNALVDFMACLDSVSLQDASISIKQSLIGKGDAEAVNVQLETNAVEDIKKTYATSIKALAVASCAKAYEHAMGLTVESPPAPTGSSKPGTESDAGATPEHAVEKGELRGIVTDELGKAIPLAALTVLDTGAPGDADSHGNFVLLVPANATRVRIRAEHAGYVAEEKEVVLPVASLRIRLTKEAAPANGNRTVTATVTCFPAQSHQIPRGCWASCSKGEGNPVTTSVTFAVSSPKECEQYAVSHCRDTGPGASCLYDYVPLATP